MFLEILVSGLCIGQFQCGTATKAYYQGSPELKEYAHKKKTQLNMAVPKPVATMVPLIMANAFDKKLQLKLSKRLTAELNNEEAALIYSYAF